MSSPQTVIVTGGNKGIGRATAITFAKKGYNVTISGRDNTSLNEVAKEIEKLGAKVLIVRADVGKEEDVIKLVSETVKKFGKIDVLVNNAGVAGDVTKSLADTTTENFQQVLNINVLGTYWGMKYAIKEMLKTGGGSIVNNSSSYGSVGAPNFAHYVATKHAVEGLTKATALEYATQGIRVNAVAPGPIETDAMKDILNTFSLTKEAFASNVPAQKIGVPEDVANGIVYLAAKENTFLTGSILAIDGGILAK